MFFNRYRLSAAVALFVVIAAVVWYWRATHPGLQIATSKQGDQQATQSYSTVDDSTSTAASAQDVRQTSSSVEHLQDREQWLRDLVAWLIAQDEARSLASAAALMHANGPVFTQANERRADFKLRLVELMRRSAAKAPSDLAILILAESFCLDAKIEGCDATEFENTLRQADPANALAWVVELEKAVAAGDKAAQAKAVASMASARHIDARRKDIEQLIRDGIRSARIPPTTVSSDDTVSTLDAFTVGATMFVPRLSLAPLENACNPPISESLTTQCRAVVELTRDQHGELTDVGLSVASRLTMRGSAEALELAKIRRRYSWQFIRSSQLPRSAEQNNRITLGDRGAMQEVLIANAVSLEPPDEWRGPDEWRE